MVRPEPPEPEAEPPLVMGAEVMLPELDPEPELPPEVEAEAMPPPRPGAVEAMPAVEKATVCS